MEEEMPGYLMSSSWGGFGLNSGTIYLSRGGMCERERCWFSPLFPVHSRKGWNTPPAPLFLTSPASTASLQVSLPSSLSLPPESRHIRDGGGVFW